MSSSSVGFVITSRFLRQKSCNPSQSASPLRPGNLKATRWAAGGTSRATASVISWSRWTIVIWKYENFIFNTHKFSAAKIHRYFSKYNGFWDYFTFLISFRLPPFFKLRKILAYQKPLTPWNGRQWCRRNSNTNDSS